MRRSIRKTLTILGVVAGTALLGLYPSYLATRAVFNHHFAKWGQILVDLESRGLLSRELGAAWQDVLAGDRMAEEAREISEDVVAVSDSVFAVHGIAKKDYPSLSIVRRLNEVNAYSSSIEITDRRDRRIALIRTDHTRGKIQEFPKVLVEALVAAEDAKFYENSRGFEFDSFVRAFAKAALRSLSSFSLSSPKGTSTITQQVAKLLVSRLDESGQRHVSRTIDRKIRELRLAAALRAMYRPPEILEVYLNHCVTSDYGLVGVKDIAAGLLGKSLGDLTDGECIYLARMVKWGRNLYGKIARQCRIDMPRIGDALGWDRQRRRAVLREVDSLSFMRPKQIETGYGHLVDVANEFWLKHLRKVNGQGQYGDMDIINPNSLIRRKGNLKLRLAIDLPLQRKLEQLVRARGYGPDTTILTDVRVGSYGEDVALDARPEDTLRMITVADTLMRFSEPHSDYTTELGSGDTLVTNIRYRSKGKGVWRKSCYYYVRRWTRVDGQYFAYCILDSRTGRLLAYYSRDRIGSRLAGLTRHRVPNGSSTAKPIFNALNFDLGVFPPYGKWSDTADVPPDVPWARTLVRREGKPHEVVFALSAVRGKGYRVHNHDYVFSGCQYIFDLLAVSNNIFGVETVYRLDRNLLDQSGRIATDAFGLAQFLYRIGALKRIREEPGLKRVTGVRLYKELARIVGVDVDSMTAYGRRIPVSDSLYSVALGTLEMTLHEQAHLFNLFYDNDLIDHPAAHPSLVIDEISMDGSPMRVAELDTVKRYHPFSDVNNIRPAYLGMHKRLVSNPRDGLSEYDVFYADTGQDLRDTIFSEGTHRIQHPLSNYAKSGTTDDIFRPFNCDVTSTRRTNYGIWNAVVRVDLSALSGDPAPEVRDITIACIGECNDRYTGARDGKSLHKFVSRGLLKAAGVKSPNGYFSQYEGYLRKVTPDSVRSCGAGREAGGELLPHSRPGQSSTVP